MKATVRSDGEYYRVYHNGHRMSGQFPYEQALALRDRINSGERTGCPCADCVKAREVG